jgi:hypothetical protein
MSDRLGRLEGARAALGVKMPVRCATTANITLSGFQTIDGVAIASTDDANGLNTRVLVKDQTDTTQNGVYHVQAGVWERAKDFDGNTDFVKGTLLYVAAGDANEGRFYTVSSADPPDIGEDALTFVQGTFGVGDVTGPASSVSGNVAGWDGVGGDTLQDLGSFVSLLASSNWSSTTVASAAGTTDIGAATTPWITITGTETITGLGTGTSRFRIVYFADACVLVHSAAIVLPGSANLTTAAGDMAIFASPTSNNWYCVTYLRNGSAGALTTSGFTIASGDALTTTNGHKFILYITKSQSYSLLQRKALQ